MIHAKRVIIGAIMTDEKKSDRRRTLIIAAIIILAVGILASFLWYVIMAERWESGGHPSITSTPGFVNLKRFFTPSLSFSS